MKIGSIHILAKKSLDALILREQKKVAKLSGRMTNVQISKLLYENLQLRRIVFDRFGVGTKEVDSMIGKGTIDVSPVKV